MAFNRPQVEIPLNAKVNQTNRSLQSPTNQAKPILNQVNNNFTNLKGLKTDDLYEKLPKIPRIKRI